MSTPDNYCCYLHVSAQHGRVYKGQTNNFARRIRQHNGEIKGGARATAREDCRPWRPYCIVTNLNKTEALRLVWHWMHPRGPRSRCRGGLRAHMAHLATALDRLNLSDKGRVWQEEKD